MLGQKFPSSTLRTDEVLQIGVVRGCWFRFWIYAALVPLCFIVGRALFIPGNKSVSVLSLQCLPGRARLSVIRSEDGKVYWRGRAGGVGGLVGFYSGSFSM